MIEKQIASDEIIAIQFAEKTTSRKPSPLHPHQSHHFLLKHYSLHIAQNKAHPQLSFTNTSELATDYMENIESDDHTLPDTLEDAPVAINTYSNMCDVPILPDPSPATIQQTTIRPIDISNSALSSTMSMN